MDDTNFYVATAGASAALIGLLFIAVQFNFEKFGKEPGSRWHAVARSTFAIFATLFLLSMFMLVPELDVAARGAIGLFVAAFGAFRVTRTWVPVWRALLPQRSDRLWQTIWLLIGPLLAYFYLALNLFDLGHGAQTGGAQEGIEIGLVILFTIALRNSWNLLVETTYEKITQ